MQDNQIYFNIKDDKVRVSYKKELPLMDFLQITLTGILNAMLQIVKVSDNPELTKEELYDMFNKAASRTLEIFAPEIEMRPDLTTQAILEAEDKIIERALKGQKKKK